MSGVPKWPGDRIGTALCEASRTAQEIIFPCLCETEDRRGLVHINISTFADFRETLYSSRVQHSQFVICHSKIVNIFQTINHVSIGLKWDDSSSLLLSLEGFRGAVAWSCGHYIGHYIRHIRLIFGNFYYFCPDVCHTTSRPVPVTQGRSGIQTERVTDGRQVIYQSIAELIGLTRL